MSRRLTVAALLCESMDYCQMSEGMFGITQFAALAKRGSPVQGLCLLAYFKTEFMNCINQYTKVVGIHRLVDAVTEVEDVSAVIAETCDDVLCFCTDGIGICIEYAGVEVAL